MSRARLAVSTTPTDPTPNPANGGQVSAGDDFAPSSAGSMSYEFADGSMRLVSSGMTSNAGGDVIHGPYIISDNSVSLSVGDTVTFNWKAAKMVQMRSMHTPICLIPPMVRQLNFLMKLQMDHTDWAPADA